MLKLVWSNDNPIDLREVIYWIVMNDHVKSFEFRRNYKMVDALDLCRKYGQWKLMIRIQKIRKEFNQQELEKLQNEVMRLVMDVKPDGGVV